MTCLEFVVWFGSGALIVPLIGWLKGLPKVGPIFAEWAWILAPVLAAVLPQLAALLQPHCETLDPKLWALILAALTYLVSQLIFWVNKKVFKIGRPK